MDITKCSGDKCQIKDHCKRFTTQQSDNQSWINPPFKLEGDKFSCELFWSATQDAILEQLLKITNK